MNDDGHLAVVFTPQGDAHLIEQDEFGMVAFIDDDEPIECSLDEYEICEACN